ncbi:hypothetical protein HDU67_004954 [Dinochytrium kinnereticum]|nr:hypothetical protein HDU67_004954 [Dinochytrium kinnereticum]
MSQEVLKEKEEAMAEARRWLVQNRKRFMFSEGSGRANFAGKEGKPFPMNKYFTPVTPLNDQTREEIYTRYKKDPTKESPLKLATHYRISIARVNAILRLKALERQQVKEGSIQVHLTKGMERLLTATDSSKRLMEKPYVLTAERLKPLFQLVNEESYMTPEDAAELLDLEPYANREIRLNTQAEKMAKVVEATSEPRQNVMAAAAATRGKKTFLINDISNPAKATVFVKEGGEPLRKVTRAEKLKRFLGKPVYEM